MILVKILKGFKGFKRLKGLKGLKGLNRLKGLKGLEGSKIRHPKSDIQHIFYTASSITTRTWLLSTVSPSATSISLTIPALAALNSLSIFIAETMITV